MSALDYADAVDVLPLILKNVFGLPAASLDVTFYITNTRMLCSIWSILLERLNLSTHGFIWLRETLVSNSALNIKSAESVNTVLYEH
jgi:hypothetical protein